MYRFNFVYFIIDKRNPVKNMMKIIMEFHVMFTYDVIILCFLEGFEEFSWLHFVYFD